MPEIVPATEAMVRAVTTEQMPYSVRAIAAVDGDRVLGVAGFYPKNGRLVLIASIAKDARAEISRHKRTLVRCARRVMGMVAALEMPVYAEADPHIDGSASLLVHLGFTHTGQGIYTWLGHR